MKLKPIHAKVIADYYSNPNQTLREIGNRYGISEQNVSRIISAYMMENRLMKKREQNGEQSKIEEYRIW